MNFQNSFWCQILDVDVDACHLVVSCVVMGVFDASSVAERLDDEVAFVGLC